MDCVTWYTASNMICACQGEFSHWFPCRMQDKCDIRCSVLVESYRIVIYANSYVFPVRFVIYLKNWICIRSRLSAVFFVFFFFCLRLSWIWVLFYCPSFISRVSKNLPCVPGMSKIDIFWIDNKVCNFICHMTKKECIFFSQLEIFFPLKHCQ